MRTIPLNKEELEKVFRYDVESNVLERELKSGEWRAVNTSVANSDDGYVRATFNGRTIRVHRIIYTLMHENIPDNMDIDHIDEVKTNNHISNLHRLTRRDNVAKSRFGIKPCFCKDRNSYQAQVAVMFCGKRHNFHFKYFKIKSEALDFCNAYNNHFGYGKPLYKARLSTHKYWRSCMQTFKDSYFNTREKYA